MGGMIDVMPSEVVLPPFDAIVLAGGRGSRLGGVDKASLLHGGVTLLQLALDAVAGASRIVVVGDRVPTPGVLRAVEDPVGSGPAAAIAAGMSVLEHPAELVAVLACDVPGVGPALTTLRALGGPAVAVDTGGRRQHLLALYPGPALATRCAQPTSGLSVRRLVEGLDVTEVVVDAPDVDDPSDARRLGVEL